MIHANAFEQNLLILKEELVEAMGCTEPIALAYAGARARQVLGKLPDKVVVRVSGNMLKNVRCVIIPNSGDKMGIEVAVLLGVVGGDSELGMDVLKNITEADRAVVEQMNEAHRCTVEYLDSPVPLHIVVTLFSNQDCVELEIKYAHVNVVRIVKNGEVLFFKDDDGSFETPCVANRALLSIEGIKQFADEVDLAAIEPIIEPQIRCNMNIAYEGMSGEYGVGIGRIIRECYPDSVATRMKAYTAAASEARMGGCDMPVIINSGSGNQGIAASVPVIVYARENNISAKKLTRALAFSNLVTIYQKEYIGRLSAFCGAVPASCASGAALTYICGGSLQNIVDTIDNTLANVPGIICDGAKVSCAAKIAASLDASILAHFMAMKGQAYGAYTGILQGCVGDTISSVGHIGRVGMLQTDREIIQLMLGGEVASGSAALNLR